jgi:hypothetical protein
MSRPLIEEEIMAEYIEREAILRHLDECKGTPPETCYTYPIFVALECFVKNLPAADVAEVKRGEWVRVNGFSICSNCGSSPAYHCPNPKNEQGYPPFCYECGAKMKG